VSDTCRYGIAATVSSENSQVRSVGVQCHALEIDRSLLTVLCEGGDLFAVWIGNAGVALRIAAQVQNAELLRGIQNRFKLFGEPGALLLAVTLGKVAEIQVLRGLLIVLIATRLKKTGNRGARILTAETIRGRRRRGRSLKYRDGKRERECPDLHPPYGDAIGEPSRVCNATELVRNRLRKSRVKSSVERSPTVAARFGGCAKSATYRAARVSERSALGFSHGS
jgi:hypothetical protein